MVFSCLGWPAYYEYVNTVEGEEEMACRLRAEGFEVLEVRNFGAAPFTSLIRIMSGGEYSPGTLNLFVARKAGITE